MGLLDDAIRDHLELKRRRGADPGEVAREQREALEHVSTRESASTPDTAGAGSQDISEDSAAVAGLDADAREDRGELASEGAEASTRGAPSATDASALAQETEELDMESVLDERNEMSQRMPQQSRSAERRDLAGWADELEDDAEAVREIPGQERLSFE